MLSKVSSVSRLTIQIFFCITCVKNWGWSLRQVSPGRVIPNLFTKTYVLWFWNSSKKSIVHWSPVFLNCTDLNDVSFWFDTAFTVNSGQYNNLSLLFCQNVKFISACNLWNTVKICTCPIEERILGKVDVF